ncbi:scabin-related ADP-ribosyltransferase [Pseudoalteromonas sp. Angola-18]|jgi:hypothetical protein|uniref:scabin-related ADP-ribosyltransferase n=1 Tax=Pseudoalteromonas sp. Angola-18 TaxID=3025338 RepID=UPI002359D7AC|nr:hypothetical protein [Pseudoalteromonas sp. Angola-18]MCP4056509.1 hypothetical protein [Pseudoalteromonas sp.]MDC9502879.1 hypothetical protein [Pseudoalteromonas sp. Angola-18]|tara:strand:+ start:2811 stop:3533 length:723 start_codon:yes stop_codon:yes gene_type:complete
MVNSDLDRMLDSLEKLRASNEGQEAFDVSLAALIQQINNLGNEGVLAFKKAFSGFIRPSLGQYLESDGQSIPGQKDDYILGSVFRGINILPEPSSKSVLPKYVYRGCGINPEQVIRANGFYYNSGESNLMKHQESTIKSIFISATTNMQIAREFACQHPGRWVYKISSHNSISVNDYFSPYYLHQGEGEVVFIKKVPLHHIKGVAWAKDWDVMETDFYPIDQWASLVSELVNKGVISLRG